MFPQVAKFRSATSYVNFEGDREMGPLSRETAAKWAGGVPGG